MTENKSNSSFLLTNEEAAAVFEDWNSTTLEGSLNEITSKILRFKDTDNSYLIDKICDTAGQKGTGKWTVEEGCRFNHTVSVISEAVFARNLSSDRNVREAVAVELPFQTPDKVFEYASSHEIIEDLGAGLLGVVSQKSGKRNYS